MSTAKNILKNTFLLSGQQMLMQIASVFVIGYVASKLGVEEYGIFLFSLSFVSIFSLLSNLGTRTYTTKEIAANKSDASKIFAEMLPLRLILAVSASIIAFIVINILPYSDREVLLVEIAIISQLCAWIYANTFIVYEAFEMMAYPVTIDLVIRIFVLIGIMSVVYFGYGVVGVAICYAAGNFIEIFVAFFFLHKRFFRPQYIFFPFKVQNAINLLKLSFPYCLIGIFNILIAESDKVMLSLIDGSVAVGLYGVAFTLSSRLSGIVDALGTAFFPVIIRLKGQISSESFRDKITESLQALFVLTAPLAFGIFSLSDEIVKIVYRSSDFAPSALTLEILIIGLPIGALTFIFGFSLLAEGKQIILVKLNALILCVNLILNYFLISSWSYNGAAIATIISIVTKFICLLIVTGEIVRWLQFTRTVVATLIIGSMMCLLVNWIKDSTLAGAIVLGALFYVSMIIATKTIDIRRFVIMFKKGKQ